MSKIVIAGGGLSGGLVALALKARRPDVELLVIEQGETFGGNHIWSFFDTDIASDRDWVLGGIDRIHWRDTEVRFPRRQRTISIGYNSIHSKALDVAIKRALRPREYRLGQALAEIAPTHVVLTDGERIDADAVIDARGPGEMPGQQLGWQKFLGRTYRFGRSHAVARPVIMDATVEQRDGYRFQYLLPLNQRTLLIEDTYYSPDRSLDCTRLAAEVDCRAAKIADGANIIAEETGVLPVLIRGDFEQWWPKGEGLPRVGLRGGFFHPTTSYSLLDAVATAAFIAEQQHLGAAALANALRERAIKAWRDRSFYQLLNRMLFGAAKADEEYRVLEHFYRLPAATIGRFYAGRLTVLDKLRILSGRPPVPLGLALRALIGKGV